jgi:quinoprotein glucose dehydrogenase
MGANELPLGALLADPSPRVRYFAALAVGRLHATGFYGAICSLLAANDNRDPYLRHAGAYALRHLASNPLMLTGLERHPSAAVRLGAAIALRRTGTADAAAFINDPDPMVADESIRAVTDLDLPEARTVVAILLDDPAARQWPPFVLRRVAVNAYRAGGAENAGRLLRLVGLKDVPESLQLEVLALLKDWTAPSPVNRLTGCWSPLPGRDAAEVKPALGAALPRLLALPEPLRAAVLVLAETYQLLPPGAAPGALPGGKPEP